MKRVFENTAIACFKLAICNRRNYRIANFDETAPGPQLVRRWKGLGYMGLQSQKLGCGHQVFF